VSNWASVRILLLHPPVNYYMPPEYMVEPLGIEYIASTLRRDGHEVEIFDAHLQCLNLRQVIRELENREFDCLGISATAELRHALIAIARAVRKRRKDAIIAAGGYLPTLSAEQLLAACPELDFVVRGEGEQIARDVFGHIACGEEWHDAPGIGSLKGKTPILNPVPPLIQDLDALPFPSREGLMQAKVPTSAAVTTSRGCYHRCSFCAIQSFYAVSAQRVPRFRSAENVVNEVESVIAEVGTRRFRFIDDDFMGPGPKIRERVIRIAEEIRSRKLGITFSIECRCDEVDEDLLKLLKEVGLTDVFLGVESGVQRQLDTYNKRVTVEQNKRAIETVRRLGFRFRAGFMMFDPYLTMAELEENMRFIREMGLEQQAKEASVPFVTKMIIHKGVPLYEKLREDGLLREKGLEVDYVFKDPLIRLMGRVALASSAVSTFFRRLLGLLKLGRRGQTGVRKHSDPE